MLKRLSPGRTGVPSRNFFTSRAGMTKLNPCKIAPLEPPDSVVAVSTPMSIASSPTTGPPELPCAAAASVWMKS